ncbi:hypothetical protein [Fontibacillus sp. BL9]|uniref:hypothetical protein n=1 Tax=Fontibacillus sp. BL9 TaxID=3389971 RepID=UPI003978A224
MESRAISLDLINQHGLEYARYSLLLGGEVTTILDAIEKLTSAPKLLEESNLTQEGLFRLMNADHQKVKKTLEALGAIEVPYGYKTKHDQLIKLLSKVSFKLGLVNQNLYSTMLPGIMEALVRDFSKMRHHGVSLFEKLDKKVRRELLQEGIEI